MREPVRDVERLRHVLETIDTIEKSRIIHTSGEAASDPIVYYGFVKHVEIIGEAVYMLSKEFKEAHPEVEWAPIEGMRHVLVHGYYHIRPQQLWDTIDYDLPELKPIIERFFHELTDSGNDAVK